MAHERSTPLVTLSASYGAGGSVIGPQLATALGVPFVDRAITVAVAARLGLSVEAAAEREELVPGRLDRLLMSVASAAAVSGGADLPVELHDRWFRDATEAVVREAADGHGAVILGRAAAVVLREHPSALHVRLTGPLERRIAQA